MFDLSSQRDTNGVWYHHGKLLVCSEFELYAPEQPAGGSAVLSLPDGVITTPMIAPSAVTQLIGSYAQAISYTLSQTNVWTETPIQVTCTFSSGVAVRFAFAFLVACPTKGQRVLWDLMVDGANQTSAALGGLDAPENNFATMASGTYYVPNAPSPGAHRVGVALNGPAGTQIFNAIWSTLYVTEERR